MTDEEGRAILSKTGRLAFGIGATIGEPPHMKAMAGGSGVFIAPFLGITVRHVSRALYDLEGGDPGYSPDLRPSQHSPFLFQLLDPTRPDSERGLWHGDQSRDFLHTDLCLMQISAEDGAALVMQYTNTQAFCELKLLPPPIGAVVHAVGYPRHSVRTDGARLFLDVPATVSEGIVKHIHSPYRERGMINFPCFEVDMWADHGFSGGPVFYENKLCGLVSAGSSFDNSVYVVALWPLLRANVDFGLGKSPLIRELFERGVLKSSEWLELRDRVVTVVSDDLGEFIDLH